MKAFLSLLIATIAVFQTLCVAYGQQMEIRPYPPGLPPGTEIRPYPRAEQRGSPSDKVYDASCFNIRTEGGFLSKTAREFIASEEAQLLGSAICTYYSGQPTACRRTAKMGADITNHLLRQAGSDYWGQIKPRPGYEVCRFAWDATDWSVTSDTTFNAQLVVDGNMTHVMSYYVSMRVGGRRGNWIDTKVILEQVPIGTRHLHACWQPTQAWLCKGENCSLEIPGARVALNSPPSQQCVRHGG